jgi:hypothetical protein
MSCAAGEVGQRDGGELPCAQCLRNGAITGACRIRCCHAHRGWRWALEHCNWQDDAAHNAAQHEHCGSPVALCDERPCQWSYQERSHGQASGDRCGDEAAAGGELTFWGDRNRAGIGIFNATADAEAVRKVAHDYLAVLRGISPDSARVTDKMPFNVGLLGVIRQVFPRATIVHCRRHPVDTCLSIFCTDFEASIDFAGERGSLVFFYRQYQRLMAHWREVLPPERFIEVDYEALVADPEPLTRRLVATCGLEWNDACLAPHRNQRHIATASLWQARQPIYRTSVERWKRYEPWLGELRELVPSPAGR